MILVTHILVPIDFSPASGHALNYGLSLALQFRARLVLAHVVPSIGALNYTFPTDTFELEKKAFQDARLRLSELVPEAYHQRLDFHSIVKTGDVRDELLATIKEEGINLVIMGTHGRRKVERFLLGSTTEAMLRRVPVPVLTVSPRDSGNTADPPAPIPIRHVVYATDYSEAAKIGLHYAVDLSRTFGAQLTVLHVMDRIELWGSELVEHVPADIPRVREIAAEKIDELLAPERSAGMRIEAALREGPPHREIVKFAEESGADVLVLNVQSKTTLERAMLGATAERVIRSAGLPVLSIPAGTADNFVSETRSA
jgi:nucleotide-binding universal stress UspA family protein